MILKFYSAETKKHMQRRASNANALLEHANDLSSAVFDIQSKTRPKSVSDSRSLVALAAFSLYLRLGQPEGVSVSDVSERLGAIVNQVARAGSRGVGRHVRDLQRVRDDVVKSLYRGRGKSAEAIAAAYFRPIFAAAHQVGRGGDDMVYVILYCSLIRENFKTASQNIAGAAQNFVTQAAVPGSRDSPLAHLGSHQTQRKRPRW
jgi:hypothetical protein